MLAAGALIVAVERENIDLVVVLAEAGWGQIRPIYFCTAHEMKRPVDGIQPVIIALDRAEWPLKRVLAETAFPPAQHYAVLRQQRNRRPTTWCL
jgi:hypothetical protein